MDLGAWKFVSGKCICGACFKDTQRFDKNTYVSNALATPQKDITMDEVNRTLSERGKRYGPFDKHAHITQCLKEVMQRTPGSNWDLLSRDKKEALEMIAHKIGRILNGDPNYKDSWHDIQGYAKLAEDCCVEN